jgi:hypothetical protein
MSLSFLQSSVVSGGRGDGVEDEDVWQLKSLAGDAVVVDILLLNGGDALVVRGEGLLKAGAVEV